MVISPSPAPVDLAQHRQQFPALQRHRYFNYGGQGPMPEAAIAAMHDAQVQIQTTGPFSGAVNRGLQQDTAAMRAAWADLLTVAPESITLTEDVTVGCNIALWGLDWQPGDRILLTDCEHPGIIATVQEISRRFGVAIDTCPILATAQGGDPVAVIAAALHPRTRLLVASHILWNTGQVLPLAELTQLCHDRRPDPVWVLSDAAQSVGMLPLNLTDLGVDFYAFTGHKWCCGPAGLGGLYVRPEVRDRLHPTFIGWRGITTDAAGNPTGWQPNGSRYEVATSDYTLIAGLRSALEIHRQWGTDAQRYDRIVALSQRLWQRLNDQPQIRCITATPPASGLVSFQILAAGEPSRDRHIHLVNTLEAEGIFLRTLLHPHCVRACTHYLTLEAEVDALADRILAAIAEPWS